MTFGLTPLGFNAKRLADIKLELDNAMIAEFGDINIDPQSVFGQLIGVLAKGIADIWENMEDVYFSEYPNSASGVSLDNVVQLNGITRLPAQQTKVTGVCQGNEGTTIPAGSLVRVANTTNVFSNPVAGLISSDNVYSIVVTVGAVAAQIYTLLLNSAPYLYSLPIITFTGDFVYDNSVVVTINNVQSAAVPYKNLVSVVDFDIDFVTSNSILATINGVPLTPVIFVTDQATTIANLATIMQGATGVNTAVVTDTKQITVTFTVAGNNTVNSVVTTLGATQPTATITDANTTITDIATVISGFSSVASATVDGSSIDVVPALGSSVTVNSVSTTGGATQPTYAITFDTPADTTEVSTYLSALINASSQPFTAVNGSGTFSVTSTDADVGFVASTLSGLTITTLSSPVGFVAQDYGPIPCPANSLTEIQTPIAGWVSVTNPKAGVTGRFIETDSELRIRRAQSIQLSGNATVEAIRAHLLQNVPGVTSVSVFENTSIYQQDITIEFAGDLITGNTVTITMNSRTLPTITYATSSLSTMTQLANLLAMQPEIDTCVVSGVTNNNLTISMNIFQVVVIQDVEVQGGASQVNHSVLGGRPPKSFECVVEGGSDADIAEEIWLSKPAGIATYGNTQHTIVDSQGENQAIFFSRPVPIYIWVNVTLTLYSEETFPSNGLQLVQQAILAYGDSLGVGVDVLLQRVNCAIFTVPGVASGVMTLAATNAANDSPNYLTNDISIDETEISNWAASRINVVI